MSSHTNAKRKIAFYLPLVLYVGFMMILVVTRFLLFSLVTGNAYVNPQHFPRQYNLIPFHTIFTTYINPGLHRMALLPVVGNILLFVPMGIYIHALSRKKRIWLSTVISLFAIVLVETTQFTLATGSFDVDDIIANFIGAFAGIWIARALYHLSKKDEEWSKIVLSIISTSVIPLLAATVIQSALRLPHTMVIPAFLAAFCIAYAGLYLLFWRREAKNIKLIFAASSAALCLLFFFLILPML